MAITPKYAPERGRDCNRDYVSYDLGAEGVHEERPEESVLIPPSLLLNLFIVIVMFSIGLRVSSGELLDILQSAPCLSVPCWRIASSYRP